VPVSLLDVISRLEKLLGKEAKLEFREVNPADIRETRAEVGKAKGKLGWTAQVDLDEGLARTVAWYEANRDWVRELEL